MLSRALALHLVSLALVRDPLDEGELPPCFVESMPDSPHAAVCVYSRAGFPAVDLSGYESPELQVVTRAALGPSEPAQVLAERIRRALKDTDTVTWAPGTEHAAPILTCDANEPRPVPLGADQKGRLRWSVSFQTELLTEEVAP
ncbi:minor capsid protein [Actinophytocola sediminis]